MNVVMVLWEDPAGSAGWRHSEDAVELETARVCTTGVIVHTDKKYIRIASTADVRQDVWNDITVIPKSLIHNIIPLKRTKADDKVLEEFAD